MSQPSNTPSPTFEESLRELEATVERLEAGELPLEESLALFEKGVGSLKRCHAILDQAEKRVQILVKNVGGTPVLADSAAAAPTPATAVRRVSARKKSDKQSIDAEPCARQNTAPCTDMEKETGQPEIGPGGLLFGGSQ